MLKERSRHTGVPSARFHSHKIEGRQKPFLQSTDRLAGSLAGWRRWLGDKDWMWAEAGLRVTLSSWPSDWLPAGAQFVHLHPAARTPTFVGVWFISTVLKPQSQFHKDKKLPLRVRKKSITAVTEVVFRWWHHGSCLPVFLLLYVIWISQ